MEKPICIIGAARSGTYLLGLLLSQHPQTVFWDEPKYLWQYRNPTASHDKRMADEASTPVRQYIRSHLRNYLQKNGGSKLVEKTPSNCFRVPFVHAVLPDARFIHLIRDGRDAAISALEQWKLINDAHEEPTDDGSTIRLVKDAWNRLQAGDVPLRDLPFYTSKFARAILRSAGVRSGATNVNVWGPKFPGIQEAAESNDLLEVCALQWKKSVQAAYEGLRSVPNDQKYELHFEALVRSPRREIRNVLNFARLPEDVSTIQHAEEKVRPDAAQRWQTRDPDRIQRVMNVAGDLIHEIEAPSRENEKV